MVSIELTPSVGARRRWVAGQTKSQEPIYAESVNPTSAWMSVWGAELQREAKLNAWEFPYPHPEATSFYNNG